MVLTEHTGLQNLYSMLCYCISESRCRRAIIARHFGERCDKEDCRKMCDVCVAVSGGSVPSNSQEDVTDICRGFLNVLEKSSLKEKRLTALKLVEAWKPLERTGSFKRSADNLERVLIHCVIEGVLKEDFHFTPYSTISYIVPARKAALVQAGKMRILMEQSKLASGQKIRILPGSCSRAGGPRSSVARPTIVPHHSTGHCFPAIDHTGKKSASISGERILDQLTSGDGTGTKRKLPSSILEDDDFVHMGTKLCKTGKGSRDPWLSRKSKGRSKATQDESNGPTTFPTSTINSSVVIDLDIDS